MPCCAIVTCRLKSQTSSIKQGGISFHRFPKEPDIRSQWIDVTGKENWIPTKTSTICSKHFRENDFIIKKSGNRFLKLGAIPRVDIVHIYTNSFSNEPPSGSSIEKIPQKRKLNDTGAMDCKKKCLGIIESKEAPFGSSMEKIPQKRKLNDTGAMDCKKKCLGITEPHVIPTEGIPPNSFCSTPRKDRSTRIQHIQESPTSNASTPRKRKLKSIIRTKESIIKRQRLQIKREQARNRRLKKKFDKIEEVLNGVQDKFALKIEDMSILRNINVQVHELTNRMVAKNSGGKSKQKYSPAIRSFALTLHYYSPKAYEYVRKTFDTCLPASRTLREWYKTIGGDPGFTTESLEALKNKARSTNYPIIAGLSIDEMAIRRRIEWDGEKLIGQVDIGSGVEGDHVTEAKEALVFLVTGVNSNFKVPIGYFFVDGVTGRQRADLILQCLELVEETGIKIISLTFDGCAANMAMVKCLNCSIEDRKVTFEHPTSKEPILVMLDPSHMIKLLRNAFQCYNTFIDPEGNKIEWKYLMQLNEVQQKENFHLVNKLRYHHVHFQNKKMKVKLATQLFSLSVAEAIDFCRDELNLPAFKGSEATCKFLRIVNNMFDIFNSRNMYQYNFKKALTETNAVDILGFLDVATKYISELKSKEGNLLIKSPRKIGFVGYIGCAEAVKHLYNYLIRTQVLVFMPMYRISQDHLEMLFGNIRSHGGGNNNPTARQFKAAYKKLLIHIELKALNSGNCTALEHISILSCASSPIERINGTSSRHSIEDNEQITVDNNEDEEINSFFQNISEFSQQIISYIAGYIAHVLLNKIKCDTCVGALLSNELNAHHKLIVAKNKGGLMYPSKDLIHICKVSESVIKLYTSNLRTINKNMLTTKILHQFVGTELFSSISYHQIGEYPISNHITDLIKAVIEKYMNGQ